MPEVFFNGPAGRLEAKYTESVNKQAPAVLLLHPHPVHGGTMDNKVVYQTYRAFVDNGFSVLRINFRGVGRSQGEFDNGVGELMDAATALDWLEMHSPSSSEIWIAGFSFGAWVAMQLIMRRPDITRFVVISPPVDKYDFSFLSPCPIPGLIIQGDQDSIVREQSVAEFAIKLNKHKKGAVDYSLITGGDHFFRTRLEALTQTVADYAMRSLGKEPTQASEDIKSSSKSQLLLD